MDAQFWPVVKCMHELRVTYGMLLQITGKITDNYLKFTEILKLNFWVLYGKSLIMVNNFQKSLNYHQTYFLNSKFNKGTIHGWVMKNVWDYAFVINKSVCTIGEEEIFWLMCIFSTRQKSLISYLMHSMLLIALTYSLQRTISLMHFWAMLRPAWRRHVRMRDSKRSCTNRTVSNWSSLASVLFSSTRNLVSLMDVIHMRMSRARDCATMDLRDKINENIIS